MSRPNRMDSARQRVRITRYAIGLVAAAAFAGGAVIARAAHPGTHGKHSTSAAQASIPSESSALQAAASQSSLDSTSGSDDSSSSSSSSSPSTSSSSSSSVSPAPAASAPVVQSSGS